MSSVQLAHHLKVRAEVVHAVAQQLFGPLPEGHRHNRHHLNRETPKKIRMKTHPATNKLPNDVLESSRTRPLPNAGYTYCAVHILFTLIYGEPQEASITFDTSRQTQTLIEDWIDTTRITPRKECERGWDEVHGHLSSSCTLSTTFSRARITIDNILWGTFG